MKKTNLSISFESEKLEVLKYHLDKKQILLQDEMYENMQKLYEKHVPQNIREYIEDRMQKKIK